MTDYSTAPAVLAGLYTLLKTWPAFADDPALVVRPAPTLSADARRKAVVVGWNGDAEDFTSVEFEQLPEGLGGDRDREQYTVRLVAETLGNDGQMATAVSQVYALMAEMAHAVGSARTPAGTYIGGVKLLRAKLGGGTLATELSQLRATLATGLVVDAFTASDSG